MTVKFRGWLARPRLLCLVAVSAMPVLYAVLVRPRLLTWGATANEVGGAYPGDELIPGPAHCSTMATTLPAPPERVWPWLVQMGYDRAGWYSWDKLDHSGQPSADRIVPQWQHLAEGQRLNSMGNGRNWMTGAVLEPGRALVLRSIYQLPSFRTFDPLSGPLPQACMDAIWGFICARPSAAGPGWWSVSAAGARGRTPGRSACCLTPCTSSCRPVSSTTCKPASTRTCDLRRGRWDAPDSGGRSLDEIGGSA